MPVESENVSQQPEQTQSTASSTATAIKTAMIYFVPPVMNNFMQWGETMMILIFIVALFAVILVLYVFVNISEYRTRISVISNAALFGKNPQAMFQYYIQNAQAESIATAMNNIQNSKEDANSNNYRLDDKSTLLSRQSAHDVPNSNAQSNSLGISIQKGIAQMRDTVSKLGGAFVLNNYMNNGAVKTTQSPK
jgi:Tfp pilus assembly protein PilE